MGTRNRVVREIDCKPGTTAFKNKSEEDLVAVKELDGNIIMIPKATLEIRGGWHLCSCNRAWIRNHSNSTSCCYMCEAEKIKARNAEYEKQLAAARTQRWIAKEVTL